MISRKFTYNTGSLIEDTYQIGDLGIYTGSNQPPNVGEYGQLIYEGDLTVESDGFVLGWSDILRIGSIDPIPKIPLTGIIMVPVGGGQQFEITGITGSFYININNSDDYYQTNTTYFISPWIENEIYSIKLYNDIGPFRWWNGPNEYTQYCIGGINSEGNTPNPDDESPCYLIFWGSKLNELDFINRVQNILNNNGINNIEDALEELHTNGYWTNYKKFDISAGSQSMFTRFKTWSWGLNTFGALGDNTLIQKESPVSICNTDTFIQVSAGALHGLALNIKGDIWAWGRNGNGQLGDNSTTSRLTPVAVCGNHTFTQISGGTAHSLAIDINGQAWTWGSNGQGRLGDNSTTSRLTPVAVCGNHTFTQISVGGVHSLAIDINGQAWAWGNNGGGQLGDNSTTSRRTPVAVCGNHTFTQISGGGVHSLAIDINGQAWAWGGGGVFYDGQIGDNTLTPRLTPVAVCGNHTFTQISAGSSHSLAIDIHGQAWAWGFNQSGRLGDNSTTPRLTPVAVCGNHTFIQISAGDSHSLAIDIQGQAWAWGNNGNGRLGDNTTTSRLTPVAVFNNYV